MTAIIETVHKKNWHQMIIFFAVWITKKKFNSTLESIGVSPVNIHGVVQHCYASNAKCKLKKVLNMYKENISAAYISISDWDTKNKV